jgi:tetratricopeptide (TPR) repeat protein
VERGAPRRRLRLAAIVLGAVTLAYLVVRVAVLGALARPLEGAPGFASSLPSIPVAAAAYLRLLLLPIEFSIFRPERPVAAPLDPAVLAAVAVLAGAAALAAWAVRRRPRLLLPLAWLVVWLLPVLNVWALDPQWMVTDRYLFLPSLALPWAIAVALPRRAALATLAVLAVAFGALTVRYAAIFRDERTFVTTMARVEPASPLLLAERGRLERAAGRRHEARASLERAVALDPLAPGAQLALGELKMEAGELAAAEAHFRQVLVRRPYASAPFKRLVLGWAARGEAQRARALAAETARRWPEDFEAQLLDALFRAQAGERREAESAFARARALRPDDPAIAGGLDAAAARLLPRLLPPASRPAPVRPAPPPPAGPR